MQPKPDGFRWRGRRRHAGRAGFYRTSACASLDKKQGDLYTYLYVYVYILLILLWEPKRRQRELVTGAKIDTDVYTYFSGHRRARASEALAEALHFLHAFDEKVVSPTSAPRQPHVTTTSAPRQPHVSSTSAPRQPTSAPRQPPTHPPTPLTPTPTPLSHTSS